MAKDFDVFDDAKEYDEEIAKAEGKSIEEELKTNGNLETAKGTENMERAFRAEHFKDFTTDDEIPEPIAVVEREMVLVQEFGGRFKAWHFDNLDRVQGFASNLTGKKRLFRKIEGQEELQEINAMGDSIKR